MTRALLAQARCIVHAADTVVRTYHDTEPIIGETAQNIRQTSRKQQTNTNLQSVAFANIHAVVWGEYTWSHEMIGCAVIGHASTGAIADKTMLAARACLKLAKRFRLPESNLKFGLVCLKAT